MLYPVRVDEARHLRSDPRPLTVRAFRLPQEAYFRTAFVLAGEFNANAALQGKLDLQQDMEPLISAGCVQCAYLATVGWTGHGRGERAAHVGRLHRPVLCVRRPLGQMSGGGARQHRAAEPQQRAAEWQYAVTAAVTAMEMEMEVQVQASRC